jgi:hypothetical protein
VSAVVPTGKFFEIFHHEPALSLAAAQLSAMGVTIPNGFCFVATISVNARKQSVNRATLLAREVQQ